MREHERHGQWSPRPVLVGAAWVLTLASLAWTILGDTAAGRLLTGVATVGLGLFALSGTLARPTLAADEHGIVVRRLVGRMSWPWHSVTIRVVRTQRLGRRMALLELDGLDVDGVERFTVLGWLDLGIEPERAAAELRARKPHH